MRHLFISILCLLLLLLPACGRKATIEQKNTAPLPPPSYEIALITSPKGLEDGIVLAAWEGLQTAADAAGISYQWYQPEGNDYLSAIRLAVQAGAKLIICPSGQQDFAILQAQEEYPDLFFLTVDYLPASGDSEEATLAANSCAILFSEEEAGFLAGYAAAADGYSKLGFVAQRKDAAYGIGFLQGLNAAASERGSTIEVRYGYADDLPAERSVLSMVYPWYIDGTELIFACGAQISQAVLPAAEASCAAVIGSDTDQHRASDVFVLSAVKNIKEAVADLIEAYGRNTFPAGQIRSYGLAESGVSLSIETSRLLHFTQEDYLLLLERLHNGEYEIKNGFEIEADPQSLLSDSVRLLPME